MSRTFAWITTFCLVLVSFSGNAAAPLSYEGFDEDAELRAPTLIDARAEDEDASPPQVGLPGDAVLADRADIEDLPDLSPPVQVPDYIATLQQRLDQAMQDDKVVGLAVAVLEAGRPVLVYTRGETAAGTGDPVTPQTVFRAASVSKTFTGTLLGILEEQGLLNLNAPIPGEVMRVQGVRQPSLLELVSHRSGLPPNAYDLKLEEGQNIQRIRDQLLNVNRVCSVGECYTYQNVAFAAVEAPIEAATGMTYAQALETFVFRPFGLPSASVGVEMMELSDSYARPHRGWRRSRNVAGDPASAYDNVAAAGGVNVSLEDMIRWAQVQLGLAPGLSQDVRERIHEPITDSLTETRRRGMLRERVSQTWYGLGWRIYDWEGRTLVLHQGYLSGYGAQIILEPETGWAFVALWNSDNRPAWWLWPTAMDLHAGTGPGNWLDRLED
ncbi:serine hydrolase domain-containing protein [Maricaulis sp. CAU 1757]